MALLIQMRQRIKAIQTIKKITHAMRLISMSNHSRLRSKEAPLKTYTDALNNLFCTIKSQTPTWHDPILYPTHEHHKTLVILVGSQKGLCGNFNTALFRQFELYLAQHKLGSIEYIGIGKKAIDYLSHYNDLQRQGSVIKIYPEFSIRTLFTIAQELSHEIMNAGHGYTQVFIASNKQKTFFVQKPQIFSLIPFNHFDQQAGMTQEYQWEQEPTDLLPVLAHQCVEATIQSILFQSLLAEQAARFLSMDSSTRNAQSLLETTELQYNKLRQAKITKELTELTGTF